MIAVRATPGARKNAVERAGDVFRIWVTRAPENGKANAAIRTALAKHLGLPKSRLTLVRRATSRDKVFRVN